ncbi:LysM peptidoglycan-binding domain-containing protein, partial [Xanthovirga aplysinae]|uniref:LysM peptidoglycan-binding domain-containing protein n=1 Tax=Xanthovirga aplysinae TaxID=2529853 RepID=UPI0012BC96DB
DIYFPLIEQVLREEGVPEDFKFLAMQESSFVGDAVSSSNAVGYWQFKKPSGQENGLRIDSYVDERMHIKASTKGAARYLKRNNFYFKNWANTLISFHQGLTGTKKLVHKKDFSASKMVVDKKTFWYLKKFLSYKIAYEKAVGKNKSPKLALKQYKKGGGKDLKQIARELKLDPEELITYNKWLRKGKIPKEKEYTVFYPVYGREAGKTIADSSSPVVESKKPSSTKKKIEVESKYLQKLNEQLKIARQNPSKIGRINRIPSVIAGANDNVASLAELGNITISKFRKYNDLGKNTKIKEGQLYYLKPKRRKARTHFHIVKAGENLWGISQLYGIKLKVLMRKNRIKTIKPLKAGRVLWMRFIRPSRQEIEYVEPPAGKDLSTINQKNTQNHSEDIIDKTFTEQNQKNIIPIKSVKKKRTKVPVNQNSTSTSSKRPEGSNNTAKWSDQAEENQDSSKINSVPFSKSSLSDNEKSDGSSKNVKPEGSYGLYTVKKGDTFYGISRKFGVSVEKILQWNQLTLNSSIRPGDQLKINRKARIKSNKSKETQVKEKSSKFIKHQVAPGETLYG